ncbi:MAG: hypothetical protein FD167_5141, partial [bacterium]
MLTRREFVCTAILAILTPTTFSVSIKAAEKPDFSGIWVLDKARSVNLPFLFQNVQEYLLTIKQDDKSITVSTKFTGRGQTISAEPDTFPIDGTIVEKNDSRGFKQKRSFRFGENNSLYVETEKVFSGEVQMPNANEKESWDISEEGKTLIITISPKVEGGEKQVRVFTKKMQD